MSRTRRAKGGDEAETRAVQKIECRDGEQSAEAEAEEATQRREAEEKADQNRQSLVR